MLPLRVTESPRTPIPPNWKVSVPPVRVCRAERGAVGHLRGLRARLGRCVEHRAEQRTDAVGAARDARQHAARVFGDWGSRYRAASLDYCRWNNAPQAEYLAKFGPPFGPRNLREGHSRSAAYAEHEEKDAALAIRAATEFLSGDAGLGTWPRDPRHGTGTIVEWPNVSTNAAAQWGLAAIQCLALVSDALDRTAIQSPDTPNPHRQRDSGRG